ncbi:hypothetical protein JYU34_003010 [Plutella xylostella]|uniref:Uncharacterized protein n=2 Tax=Plutella xylostella TaxID=51655 RepID=A0ABQ7QZ11_PLUXY|nr:hypothetical protein JYU34_003010 [Plutella xylostella]
MSLSEEAFTKIVHRLGQPEIDLFASRTNAKCDTYVSWKPDPDAISVDAFTQNWNRWFFYAFPPYSLILKCLQKIMFDKSSGILVFPYWPSQPWFPLLKSMLSSEIIILNDEVQHIFSQRCPPAREHTLAAARLCGSRSLEEELRRLP